MDGQWQGPHVFVVRLRDDAGNPVPGVRTVDNGAKMGLNGVDNGQASLSVCLAFFLCFSLLSLL